MTDEEVAVKLEGHDKEIGSLKHRMSDQETASKQINDIVMSVKELALNMARMLEEQKILSGRVKSLEDKPGQTWGDDHTDGNHCDRFCPGRRDCSVGSAGAGPAHALNKKERKRLWTSELRVL